MLRARRTVTTSVVAAVIASAFVALPTSSAEPGPGGFASDNVTWVANIPLDAPAIGGRVISASSTSRFRSLPLLTLHTKQGSRIVT
jgi:hypothetical protein